MEKIIRVNPNDQFFILLTILFIPLVFTLSSLAAELNGNVINVKGDTVVIRLNGNSVPAIGDLTTLYLEHNVLGEMSIGTWEITKINYPNVEAIKLDATGEAKEGVTAVIQSLNPKAFSKKENLKKALLEPEKVKVNKSLIAAAKKGSFSDVKKAIQNGADVNCINPEKDGWFPEATPLCIAAKKKETKIIELLFSLDANPLIEDKYGWNALGYAISSQDLDIINIFLNKGVSLEPSSSTGLSPLHIAAEEDGGWQIFAYLIGAGADVNARIKKTDIMPKDKHGATPLFFLAGQISSEKEVEAVMLMLLAGADVSITTDQGETALDEIRRIKEKFIKEGDTPEDYFLKRAIIIEKALRNPVQGKKDAEKFFHEKLADAVDENDINSITALDAIGFDLNLALKNQHSLLSETIVEGRFKLAKLLLKYGADPVAQDEEGRTPFLAAVFKGNLDFVKLFHEKGADPNDIPWGSHIGILHFVLDDEEKRSMELIEYLINIGADPNWQDREYNTPLHIAAKNGNIRAFEMMIDKGANPRLKNLDKQQAIELVPSSKKDAFNRIQNRVWPSTSISVRTIEQLEKVLDKSKENKEWDLHEKTAWKLVKQGDPKGFYVLGVMKHFGVGTKIDYKKAYDYFRQGSNIEIGDPDIYYYLGLYHETALGGVKKDYKKAVQWYEKAIKKGSRKANYRLGKMILNGSGVKKDPYRAFVLIKSAAMQGRGYAEAIHWLGYLYENGIGTSKNLKKAKTLYAAASEKGFKKEKPSKKEKPNKKKSVKNRDHIKKTLDQSYQKLRDGEHNTSLNYIQDHAHQGNPTAQFYLALVYYYGVGGKDKNYKTALPWFLKAGENGHAKAQDYLADMYDHGDGTQKDIKKAIKWQKKAAENGIKYSQVNLGIKYRDGKGVKKDYQEALRLFHNAVKIGYLRAYDEIGYMYEMGYGVEKSDLTAAQWYEKAAKKGYKFSQHTLGLFYKKGWGVEKSNLQAFQWFQKAAEQGYDQAQNELGLMYNAGQGVEKNKTAALKWFQKAAEQGHVKAQYNTGVMYSFGKGVQKNDAKALTWYKKAANQGHAGAQNNLGLMYEDGRGVKKSIDTARKWFKKSAEQGNKYGIKNLKRLESQ